MKNIVILTGAGISTESGISTFRDANGLWEGHDIMEVASPIGWNNNPTLVLDFYNKRRKQLLEVKPNEAHYSIKKLESKYEVNIITQNVDNLHEVAGSKNVIHLHGELLKVRSTMYDDLIYDWYGDLSIGDLCMKGYQLRPHIVWFGEEVPLLHKAINIVYDADIVIIIGTSMQVYPAAGLAGYAKKNAEIYYIDPNPQINSEIAIYQRLKVIRSVATIGVVELVNKLLNEI